MNDDNVLTAVREGFAPVRMQTPAKAIMARGAMMRRRTNSGRLTAGALAAALGAGLSVSAFGHGGTAQDAALASWTVQQQSDGTVLVTVRKLDDMAALRARLAPYGVSITPEPNPKLAMVCGFPVLPPLMALRPGHLKPLRGVPVVMPPIVVWRAGEKEVFDGAKTFPLPDGHRLRIKFVHVIRGPGKVTVEPLHCALKQFTPAKLPVKQRPTPPTPAS